MTVGAALAIIQAIIAGYPVVKGAIESICQQVASQHGLDPVVLIKAVTEPKVSEVDAGVDAEINARWQ